MCPAAMDAHAYVKLSPHLLSHPKLPPATLSNKHDHPHQASAHRLAAVKAFTSTCAYRPGPPRSSTHTPSQTHHPPAARDESDAHRRLLVQTLGIKLPCTPSHPPTTHPQAATKLSTLTGARRSSLPARCCSAGQSCCCASVQAWMSKNCFSGTCMCKGAGIVMACVRACVGA